MVERIKKCRSCSSDELEPIISLGDHYVTNFIDSKKEQGEKIPLELILCKKCNFLQLGHNAPPESMWGDQYWYKSGINRLIREDLKDIIYKSQQLRPVEKGDVIVDIGCNDGTLFDFYQGKSRLIGFEPSKNVANEAEGKGYEIINDFFNAKDLKERIGKKKAKIITAISMFYDLDNPNPFLDDVASCLDSDGLFVIQQNYLVKMLENNAFDNVCHEHRGYYSLTSLEHLLKRHKMEIFDIEQNEINGGSIRTYVKFKGNNKLHGFKGAENRIGRLMKKEKHMNLDTSKPYRKFASRIFRIKENLTDFLEKERNLGKNICGLGASTRGNTTLQYFEFGPNLIDCIFDRNPDKEGKKTVGTLIPITSPDNIQKYDPNYQLVLIWHIFKGIGDDEKEFVRKGGKFILPLPKLKVTDKV